MEEMERNANTAAGKKKKMTVMFVLLVILLIAGILVYLFFFRKREPEENIRLGYESGAFTATDEESLQKIVDDMMAKDGQMALEYSPVAVSPDGKSFSCRIINSAKNQYDMYLGIYSDDDLKDELYLTQLIRPGDGIESFKTSKELEEGNHSCVLVFTQVEEDHKTIHSQVRVVYTLNVKET